VSHEACAASQGAESRIKNQASSFKSLNQFKHQASSIKHQASSIKHQASSFKHQASSIKLQASSVSASSQTTTEGGGGERKKKRGKREGEMIHLGWGEDILVSSWRSHV
jgi:hypothetical protein